MKYTIVIFLILFSQLSFSQTDSILDQGVYRTFNLHLPAGYNDNNDYPVVLNLHGLGSSGFEQQLYSSFDAVADAEEFIVVYPDAIQNNWDLFGNTDVTFLENLVDTIRARYSTNNCLFSMGMSQGGFLSYKLACDLSSQITAIAVVTGNMITPWLNTCNVSDGMPVMHFHGTADEVVPYNGTFGIPPVEEAIAWWAAENMCDNPPFITPLPDISQGDNSTVHEFIYSGCDYNSEIILYKVIDGGHSWPGAIPIPTLGNTNQDIDASALIGDFFQNHCNSITGIMPGKIESPIKLYPNPVHQTLTVEWPGKTFDVLVYNIHGIIVFSSNDIVNFLEINCANFMTGLYTLEFRHDNMQSVVQKILIQH